MNSNEIFTLFWSERPNLLISPKAAMNMIFSIVDRQLKNMFAIFPLTMPDPAGNSANRTAQEVALLAVVCCLLQRQNDMTLLPVYWYRYVFQGCPIIKDLDRHSVIVFQDEFTKISPLESSVFLNC